MGENTELKIKVDEIRKILKLKEILEMEIKNKIAVFENETGMTIDSIRLNRIETLAAHKGLYTDLTITMI